MTLRQNLRRCARRDAISPRPRERLTLHSGWIALLVSAGTATAGELPNEEHYFNELPVVLSVTRLPQTPLELPASLTIIDRRMIEAAGVNDIPELLRLAAGFQIAHLDGTRYAATYHGLGDDYARRIQVLVDGRSVYMPATSSVEWHDLPLAMEDIERIEVLRGPNGVAFGDNSFNGVVNIITQEAKAARGSYTRVQAGQGNYRRAVVRQGGNLGDLDLRLTLEHQSDDGLDDTTINGELYSIKDDNRSNKLSLRGDWRASVNDYVQLNAGLHSGKRGYGYNETTTNLATYIGSPAFEGSNWRHFEQIKWRHINSTDNEVQVQLYHEYTDTRATFQTLSPLPVAEIRGDVVSERYAMELEQRFRLGEALRMVWGGEVRFDQVIAPGFLNSSEAQNNNMYRGFAHTEWRPHENYLINLGAMLEHNDIAGSHLSPRLAINRRLSAGHAMRISATRAYRTASLLEEHADYRAKLVSNEDIFAQLWKSSGRLQSEQITSYELGWMGSLGGLHNQYDFKLFREQLRDVISHPVWLDYPSPYPNDAIYFDNRDWADLQGAELQLKSIAADDTLFSFGYSYVRARGSETKRLDSNGDPIPVGIASADHNVPTHTFSWLVEHRLDSHWRGSLALYHVDHIAFWKDTAVNTADVRLARRIGYGAGEGELAIVARDIAGDYYDFHEERVINPRLYLSLEYRF